MAYVRFLGQCSMCNGGERADGVWGSSLISHFYDNDNLPAVHIFPTAI